MMNRYQNKNVDVRIQVITKSPIAKITKNDNELINFPNESKFFIFEDSLSENGFYYYEVIDKAGRRTVNYLSIDYIDKEPPVILSEEIIEISEKQMKYIIEVEDTGSGVDYIHVVGDKKIEFGIDNRTVKGVFTIDRNDIYKVIIRDRAGNETSHSLEVSDIKKPRPYSIDEFLESIYLAPMKPDEDKISRHSYPVWRYNDTNDNPYVLYKLDDIRRITVPHYCGPSRPDVRTANILRFLTAQSESGKDFEYIMGPSTDFDWDEIVQGNINAVPANLDFYVFFKRADGSFIPMASANAIYGEIKAGPNITAGITTSGNIMENCIAVRPTYETNNNGGGILQIKDQTTDRVIKEIDIINRNLSDASLLVPRPPIVSYVLSPDSMSAEITIRGNLDNNGLMYRVPGVQEEWTMYNGPFELNNGAKTVIAKQMNSFGTSDEEVKLIPIKSLMELVPVDPIINVETSATGVERVSVVFEKSSDTNEVDMGNGEFVSYAGQFGVYYRSTIRARATNEHGTSNTVEREINTSYKLQSVGEIDFSNMYAVVTDNPGIPLPLFFQDIGLNHDNVRNKVFKLQTHFQIHMDLKHADTDYGKETIYRFEGPRVTRPFTIEPWPVNFRYVVSDMYTGTRAQLKDVIRFVFLTNDKRYVATEEEIAELMYDFRNPTSVFKVIEENNLNFKAIDDNTPSFYSPSNKYHPLLANKMATKTGPGHVLRKFFFNGSPVFELYLSMTDYTNIAPIPPPNMYTITWDSNGGAQENRVTVVNEGDFVTIPTPPTRVGYLFDAYYTTKDTGGVRIDNNTTPNGNMRYYARWVVDPSFIDEDGNFNDGTYEPLPMVKEDDLTLRRNNVSGHTVEFAFIRERDGEVLHQHVITGGGLITPGVYDPNFDNSLRWTSSPELVFSNSVNVSSLDTTQDIQVTMYAVIKKPDGNYTNVISLSHKFEGGA